LRFVDSSPWNDRFCAIGISHDLFYRPLPDLP
jgi:hypothetical protein